MRSQGSDEPFTDQTVEGSREGNQPTGAPLQGGLVSLHPGQGILPLAKSTGSGFGEWQLPGHGQAYGDCGSWRWKGCLETDQHNQDGLFQGMAGKVFIKVFRRSCMRFECPVCYEKAAGKEAHAIESRLAAVGRSFGSVIHVTLSPPQRLWFGSFQDLRNKAYRVSRMAGFLGGACVFHPFRQRRDKSWFFSPHFHLLGYGWITWTKAMFDREGWIVKNVGVRHTVSGTALYQLSHAGVHPKLHTVTWFGRLAYNKIFIPPTRPEKEVCPICGHELRAVTCFGVGKDLLPDVEGEYWLDPAGWYYLPRGERPG